MKTSNFILSALMVITFSVPAIAQESESAEKDKKKEKKSPQDLRSWTVGVKGLFLYDMLSTVYDTDVSRDLQGLNGDKVGPNFGFDIGLEKQFTPFFGARADFRYGGLSGANNQEYYENSFYSLRIAGIFIWNNWDPQNVGSKLNFYTPVGGGVGFFEAERFLIADDSPNGIIDQEAYGMIYGGAGLMYELTGNWRIDLEVDYNIVRTDGFDGFDYGTAWDPYMSVGLGVGYTFGDKEEPAMYATNMYETPYYDLARQMERLDELETQVGSLSEKQEKEMQELRENLEMRGVIDRRQDESIDNLNKRMTDREGMDMKSTDGYKAVVFFAFDSSVLTKEAQQTILQKLAGIKGPFTIVGFADQTGPDSYNDKLKMRRAEAVKSFLVEQMGFNEADITLETGKVDVQKQNDFLRRRVEIR